MKQFGWVVGALACEHWDLGSNPRSPHITSIILFNLFLRSAHSKGSPYTQYKGLPSVLKEASEGQNGRSMERPQSTMHTRAEKSTKGLKSLGLIATIIPPNWGQHPPSVCISFLFPIFFIICFNLIISF